MSYCDFNTKLFREFTSMKTKIKPELADDWEIIPTRYKTNDGMMLFSKKLNQKVADINLRRFLQFSKEQDLIIQGLKLKGTYIIGNDRSIYTKEMFQTWKNKFESRTESIIAKKDYKVGHKYKTPCGAEFIYLGFRYLSYIKNLSYSFNETNITKITKKYYVLNPDTLNKNSVIDNLYYNITELKQKFSEDMGKVLDIETADKYLDIYGIKQLSFIYFKKDKLTNPTISLVKLSENDKELLKTTHANSTYYNCLVIKSENKFYTSQGYGRLSVKNNKIDKLHLREFYPETFTKGPRLRNNWFNLTVSDMYRIGLI